MPDFFLIAGLFLASRIDAPWRLYLDRKVLHFVYFYALWLTIQFAFKAPGILRRARLATASSREYLIAFVEPWGTLWFIYHLALFLVVTRLLKNVPWPLVWLGAAALEIAPIHTGSVLIDEFASRFVYFYSGYVFASHVFRFADEARADRGFALTGLALWAVLNGLLVFNGYGDLPCRQPGARLCRRARDRRRRHADRAERRSSGRCAGSASTRSSSTSPSSCRWRSAARCC